MIASYVMMPDIVLSCSDTELEPAAAHPVSIDLNADCEINEAANASGQVKLDALSQCFVEVYSKAIQAGLKATTKYAKVQASRTVKEVGSGSGPPTQQPTASKTTSGIRPSRSAEDVDHNRNPDTGDIRTVLAALHYNENADKGQAMTQSGELRWKVKHPKARNGEASVSSLKQEPTYGYVNRLFCTLEEYVNGGTLYVLPAKPPHVASSSGPVDKTSLVQSHLSRFGKQ
ncbi:hypothetical protein HPB49_018262 [Dermacentor silvarum]|uniref:Uncharacterized protein n=1 Tax=Dermacentor silvarum TaxID=543639 RepID=A0ACB8CZ34_DERSI|nr:hypothetical protein HPB49_018262 [Dermacentor silvarum]